MTQALFAMEDNLALTNVDENYVLSESTSYEDPVLLKDVRVLANILSRQDEPNIDNYFVIQSEIKPHMRKIVTDWMLEVCEDQKCQPDVFSLAVSYMDKFLGKVDIQKSQFQLLAAVCIFLASKFKETTPVPAENLVIYTDNSISTTEITQWEMIVLSVLEWDLSSVTSYSILDLLFRTLTFDSSWNMTTVRRHAETFVALAVTEHSFCIRSPAVVAVACIGEALRGLNSKGLESMLFVLQSSTGVNINTIKDCMIQIQESISLSMSGSSYQPENNVPIAPLSQSKPKVYSGSASTTPTDLMDVSSACVY